MAGHNTVSSDLDIVFQLETLPLHSTDLLTLLDEDGIIRYDSPAIERIYGYEQDELVGHHVAEYFHPDDRERVLSAFEALTNATEHHVETVEHRFLVADGSYKWIESIGSSIQTPNGYYVINTRDISARKERERELDQARQQIEAERDGKEAIRQLLLETATDGTLAENVCQQLVATHGYTGAWIVRAHSGTSTSEPLYQIDAVCGDDTFRCSGSPDADTEVVVDEVTREVLASGEMRTVTVVSTDDNDLANRLVDCRLECVRSVPLEHGGVSDGVLTVVCEGPEPALSGTLVTEFAAALGFKRTIRRQREALRSEILTEISVRLGDGHFLAILSTASILPDETRLRAHELQSVDGMVTYLIKTADVDAEILARAARGVEGLQDVTPVSDSEPAVVRVRVPEPGVGTIVTNHGGSVTSVTAVEGRTELVSRFPNLTDVGTVTATIRAQWPDARVRARNRQAVDVKASSSFESLTGKQEQALRAATVAGFFERPQRSPAADIAETLGISQSTFLHHLRAAERKVFSETFDDSAESSVDSA
ncbi:MAG: PAS domain S-box protein [Halobacteriota archaeon]